MVWMLLNDQLHLVPNYCKAVSTLPIWQFNLRSRVNHDIYVGLLACKISEFNVPDGNEIHIEIMKD